MDSNAIVICSRGGAYSRTGVDGICIFGQISKSLLVQLNRVTDLPLMLIDYKTSCLSCEELMQLGVRIHFNGRRAFEDSVKAVYQSLLQLHQGGGLTVNRVRNS